MKPTLAQADGFKDFERTTLDRHLLPHALGFHVPAQAALHDLAAVSYTHLTLPTNREV